MADSFGLKLGIEGEKEFKKSLAEINQTFKVLGSEMKLVSSQFDKNDNSVQALSARNTLDCLKYIRMLKDKNIPVFFEKEAINTMDAKGEVLLTIMASLAQ